MMKPNHLIIIFVLTFSPTISKANNEDCHSYIQMLNKHNFITYTMEGQKINYILRYRNGLFKEFTGYCKTNGSGRNYELLEYYSESDTALFLIKTGSRSKANRNSYLLIDIKNGEEHNINSATKPLISPDKKRIVSDFSKQLTIYNISGNNVQIEYQTPEKNNQYRVGDMVYSLSTIHYMDSSNRAATKASNGWISNNEIKFQHFEIGNNKTENYEEQFLILTEKGWNIKQ